MWLLLPIVLVITPTINSFAPPMSNSERTERLNYMNVILKDNVYNEGIAHYINFVDTKYKFSKATRNIFNERTIRLVLENSESYPSIVVAQAILETGWGKYAIGNNYFGIKGKGHIVTTQEWNGEHFITIKASFQYYSSLAEGIRAHSKLLHSRVYNIGEARTCEEAIERIRLGRYATDPNYAKKLMYIIEQYDLHQLDNLQTLYESYVI